MHAQHKKYAAGATQTPYFYRIELNSAIKIGVNTVFEAVKYGGPN